jgi:hypothetical protein
MIYHDSIADIRGLRCRARVLKMKRWQYQAIQTRGACSNGWRSLDHRRRTGTSEPICSVSLGYGRDADVVTGSL